MKTTLVLLITSLLFFDSTILHGQITPFKKGDFRIDLKLPHINFMSFNPEKRFTDSKFGFNGYGIGIEYNYSNRKFIETSFSYMMTFRFPFPVPIDAEYNKILTTYYFSITDNYVKNRFSFGYGINYSNNKWLEWTRDLGGSRTPKPIYRNNFSNQSIGVTLNSYCRIWKSLNLGLIYRPTFISQNGFNFENLISIELNWRIKAANLKRTEPN